MRHSIKHFLELRNVIYQLSSAAAIASILALSSPNVMAANNADEFSTDHKMILDARAVNFSGDDVGINGASFLTDDSVLRLTFKAYDRTFSLSISENTKITEQMQTPVSEQTKLYKGSLDGVSDSWVRLSRRNGVYSGAIYDGKELFIIDEKTIVVDEAAPWLQQQVSQYKTESVIYRLSDSVDTSSCGLEDKSSKKSRYQQLVDELQGLTQQNNVALAAAERQLNVAIVTDTQYAASSRGDTRGQVLSQMNVVDGIFSEQVGVKFAIDRIVELSNNGSLTSTNSSSLLNAFRSYVNREIPNPGLAHLFSGKNLDGNVIGIAYLRALCTRNGVGVTQAGGRGVSGALTAAHEFGHNFGAPHDNQGGSACASTSGRFLMNPSLNGSDQFSNCSLNQMAPIVRNASCLVDITNPQPTPTPVPTPTATPVPTPSPSCTNLESVRPFTNTNTGSFSASGCSSRLTGNIWRASNQTFTIRPDTVLSFEFAANNAGEIHGIGFDENNTASRNRIFQLSGSQNWGVRRFSYTGNGRIQRFEIPVGQFYTGSGFRLILVNDKDRGSQNNQTVIRNVRLSN